MASLGLGLAEGRKLWETERNTAETNRRYLAEAGLFDMQLSEQEEAMKLQQEENVLLRDNKKALYANSEAMSSGDPNGYVSFLNQTNKDPNAKWGLSEDGKSVEFVDRNGMVISKKPALTGEAAIESAQRLSIPTDMRANMERERTAEEKKMLFEFEKIERKGIIEKDLAGAQIAGQMQIAGMNNGAAMSRLKMQMEREDMRAEDAAQKLYDTTKVKARSDYDEKYQGNAAMAASELDAMLLSSMFGGQPIVKSKDGGYVFATTGETLPALSPEQEKIFNDYKPRVAGVLDQAYSNMMNPGAALNRDVHQYVQAAASNTLALAQQEALKARQLAEEKTKNQDAAAKARGLKLGTAAEAAAIRRDKLGLGMAGSSMNPAIPEY